MPMNKTIKLVLGVCVALLVALVAGWLWGASGKGAADRALQAARLQSELLEARGAVLDARLDIYNINFGNASRHLETAKTLLRTAGERIKSDGRTDEAKRVDDALSEIDVAQQMSGKLDQGAHAHAASAVGKIDGLLGAAGNR
jgi:hypothetical protein